ncbi:uncharacterized protein METZ01_LOCUS216691 [marine metagenome]|uniref:Uncharacterized protein n=1 Tax=marine metagenome TaxID=408172 RepID=A0A382FP02_9ZZZZ
MASAVILKEVETIYASLLSYVA